MSITLLHTSDWQLGKRFAHVPGDSGALLREQRFKTAARVADLASERGIDAILVAGDLFDTNAVEDRTLIRVRQIFERYDGPWVVIPGNHDPARASSAWTRLIALGLPENVRLCLVEEPVELPEISVAVLPAVLSRPHETRDLTEWFDQAETPDGAFRIGLAHGSVPERLPEQSEAPNPVSEARARSGRLDYLALGDWHGTHQINGRTWYSGTPEQDRIRSIDAGNVLLVTLTQPGAAPTVEKIQTGEIDWRDEGVDITDPSALERLSETLDGNGRATYLRLRAAGVVDLEALVDVERRLTEIAASVIHLDLNRDDIVPAPTEDDLDRIDVSGFVRTALEQLRSVAAEPGNLDAPLARDALVRLYEIHAGLGSER